MKRVALTRGLFAIVDDEDYECVTVFKWYAHKRCGYFYAARHVGNDTISLHRWLLNAPEGVDVDHQNHDTLDCQRSNLRLVSRSENCMNRRPVTGRRYKGVYIVRDKRLRQPRWGARIKVCGRPICIGHFVTEAEAARAYNEAALKYFGAFACLNEGV